MVNRVVLLHGFNKNKNDMKVLESNLLKHQIISTSVNLPLTFEDVENCTFIFEGIFERIIQDLNKEEKITLVGHSSGGLVIRKFLSETKLLDKIHKCVLIATPNHGTLLADYAEKYSKPYTRVFKTVQSLHTQYMKALQLRESSIEIGAIAGNNCNLVLGKLLKSENDGRVEVQSVYFQGLKDFIVLPYGHKDIHYQQVTADLINNFICSGKF